MKTRATTPEERNLHRRNVLQTRQRSFLKWMGVLAFITCQGAGTAIAVPALQQAGLTWVAALFAIAGVLFLWLVGSLGAVQKLLWPKTLSDVKATASGQLRAAD